MELERHHFDCQCSDFGHIFRLTYDPIDADVTLTVSLNHFDPWYKRIWNAVRYVFKRTTPYGHYDVTILRQQDYARFHALLDRSAEMMHRQGLLDLPELTQE